MQVSPETSQAVVQIPEEPERPIAPEREHKLEQSNEEVKSLSTEELRSQATRCCKCAPDSPNLLGS